MREIKFRAWHKGYDEMYPIMLYDKNPGDCLRWKNEGQPVEIMQYTGLKDNNGKEIYEGDVVHCAIMEADRTGFRRDFIATVEEDICNPCFVLKQENGQVEYDFVMCGLMILEVVGNIYEQSHLLKEASQ